MSLALMLGFVYMLLVPCVAPPLSLLHRQLLCLLLFLSSSLWLAIVSKCALMFDIICRDAGRQFSRDAAAAVLAFWLPFIVPEAPRLLVFFLLGDTSLVKQNTLRAMAKRGR